MAFKIDMDDLKARAKARASGQQTAQPEPWLMAKPANVAKTANETPEVLAKLAGLATLATLAISQQPREGVTTSPSPVQQPTESDTRKVRAVVEKAGRYAIRVERFASLGIANPEALAERLALRDRDIGDRRSSCAECQHLRGTPGAWRCGNYRRADVGGPAIPSAFVAEMLQNCRGFRAASQMISENSEGGF